MFPRMFHKMLFSWIFLGVTEKKEFSNQISLGILVTLSEASYLLLLSFVIVYFVLNTDILESFNMLMLAVNIQLQKVGYNISQNF